MAEVDYIVLDKCKVGYDMALYDMMKKHFETEDIKICLVADCTQDYFGYWVEVRKVVKKC